MAGLILYATAKDIELLRCWINDDPSVAWIVKVSQNGNSYMWKATWTIDSIPDRSSHYIWHVKSGQLNIPSGRVAVPDAIVADPFRGWTQHLEDENATTPWFGANLPGPFLLRFCETGKESIGAIGRSEVGWDGNYYRSIGKPAHPDAMRWWQRLKRFILKNSIAIPWGPPNSRVQAQIMSDALVQNKGGRNLDVNPS